MHACRKDAAFLPIEEGGGVAADLARRVLLPQSAVKPALQEVLPYGLRRLGVSQDAEFVLSG